MPEDYVLKMSKLQAARASKDREFLKKQFAVARKTLEKGGEVRLDKEYSDASVETVHVINNNDDLKKLEEEYLP